MSQDLSDSASDANGWAAEFSAIKTLHADDIVRLAALVTGSADEEDWGDWSEEVEETFQAARDDLAAALGGDAANDSSDDEDEQECEIEDAEEWISDLADEGLAEQIAIMIWSQGVEDAEAKLREALNLE